MFEEDNHLYSQATGQEKFEMFALGENKFFMKDFYAQIEFNLENDKVVSLSLIQNNEVEAKKIE